MRLRIATFNVENLDHRAGQEPGLEKRIAALRPALLRLDADVVRCHGCGVWRCRWRGFDCACERCSGCGALVRW